MLLWKVLFRKYHTAVYELSWHIQLSWEALVLIRMMSGQKSIVLMNVFFILHPVPFILWYVFLLFDSQLGVLVIVRPNFIEAFSVMHTLSQEIEFDEAVIELDWGYTPLNKRVAFIMCSLRLIEFIWKSVFISFFESL